MNRFLQHKSVLAVGLIWLSIASLFADGANLTDLYSEFVTIHFDECNGPEIADQIMSSCLPFSEHGYVADVRHSNAFTHSKAISVKRAILDQDSPSLAAISAYWAHPFKFFPQEEHLLYRRESSDQLLYLSHCTLLL